MKKANQNNIHGKITTAEKQKQKLQKTILKKLPYSYMYVR